MFYTYNQNNSGGSFVINENVGQYVIIEADSSEEADRKAEDVGIYFNGCDNGQDCSCCGDRWYPCWEEGTERPEIYGQSIEEYKNKMDMTVSSEFKIHIYHKDGEHEVVVFDAQKQVEQNKEKERKTADKLWGVNINLTWDLSNLKPRRFYQQKRFVDSDFDFDSYWDKSGNRSLYGPGIRTMKDNPFYITFGSKNKKDVQEFINGIVDGVNKAKEQIATTKLDKNEDPYTLGRKEVLRMLGNLG